MVGAFFFLQVTTGHLLAAGRYLGLPVAVPEKFIGLSLILEFFDRCHSLTSLHLPPAALGSLPWKNSNANTKDHNYSCGLLLYRFAE